MTSIRSCCQHPNCARNIFVVLDAHMHTISIPHIGQASPFGQSLSDRDVFRLRLAPVDQIDQILTNGFHALLSRIMGFKTPESFKM